ncbi:hypothetical protein A9O67_11370 [Tepidimonas fonticaldi]|uniref:Uncharacterized protein n=2 Tax=Tepidimonas fonticaldi TaxID=1101373 RepID=A0A1A6DZ40_9BURK|nr:hypothetical protein A9O67_11370 [Tepidimonas fonticaldi]
MSSSSARLRGRRLVLLSGLLGLASVARGQTWRFVDTNGVVHLGNQQAPADAQGVTWLGPDARGPLPPEVPPPTRLAGYHQVRASLRAAAADSGLDLALVTAVAAAESSFNPKAVSRKGAIGLMQVMPDTAMRYGVVGPTPQAVRERLFDPDVNAQAGSRVLQDLLRRFGDRLELALAAYNAGEGAVRRYGGRIPPFPETEQYVVKVLGLYVRWQTLV